MWMNIIAQTFVGKEFLYKANSAVLCKSKKQAKKLAEFLNNNNDSTNEPFKLKDGEIWHTYQISEYDREPMYEVKTTKGKIVIKNL